MRQPNLSQPGEAHPAENTQDWDIEFLRQLLRERAALAKRIQRTPHPGMDDPEPDYDF
jgi:hypothetical protein